jgi:hypothetical protein
MDRSDNQNDRLTVVVCGEKAKSSGSAWRSVMTPMRLVSAALA